MLQTLALMLSLLDASLHARSQSVQDFLGWGSEREQPYPSVHWFEVSTYREAVQFRWAYSATWGPTRDKFDAGGPTRFQWRTSPPMARPHPQLLPYPWTRMGLIVEGVWEPDEEGRLFASLTVALPHGWPNLITGMGPVPLGPRN